MSLSDSVLSELNPAIIRDFNLSEVNSYRTAVVEYLNSLQLPILNKTALEVGSGPGLMTSFLTSKGCQTLSLDARPLNVESFKVINPDTPIQQFDLERDDWDTVGEYDICLASGILNHVENSEGLIEKLSVRTKEILIVVSTTECSNDFPLTNVVENSGDNSTAVNGIGSRYSRDYLWTTLRKHFPYVYSPVNKVDHPDFVADFSQSKETHVIHVCSKTDLENSNLTLDYIHGYPTA